MAIPKMTDDLEIIQALSDLPNSEDGLSAQDLKAKFDAAGLSIQKYLLSLYQVHLVHFLNFQ